MMSRMNMAPSLSKALLPLLLLLLRWTTMAAATELTQSSFQAATADKVVFIMFYQESCGYCRKMKGDWEKLSTDYANHDKYLVASVNCMSNENRSWCRNTLNIKGYPTLLYGNPINHGRLLEEYDDERNYEALSAFAQAMFAKPNLCGPDTLELCSEEVREMWLDEHRLNKRTNDEWNQVDDNVVRGTRSRVQSQLGESSSWSAPNDEDVGRSNDNVVRQYLQEQRSRIESQNSWSAPDESESESHGQSQQLESSYGSAPDDENVGRSNGNVVQQYLQELRSRIHSQNSWSAPDESESRVQSQQLESSYGSAPDDENVGRSNDNVVEQYLQELRSRIQSQISWSAPDESESRVQSQQLDSSSGSAPDDEDVGRSNDNVVGQYLQELRSRIQSQNSWSAPDESEYATTAFRSGKEVDDSQASRVSWGAEAGWQGDRTSEYARVATSWSTKDDSSHVSGSQGTWGAESNSWSQENVVRSDEL